MLTFVEFEGVSWSNNHAAREVRPAVLMRKVSYGTSVKCVDAGGVDEPVPDTVEAGLDPTDTKSV